MKPDQNVFGFFHSVLDDVKWCASPTDRARYSIMWSANLTPVESSRNNSFNCHEDTSFLLVTGSLEQKSSWWPVPQPSFAFLYRYTLWDIGLVGRPECTHYHLNTPCAKNMYFIAIFIRTWLIPWMADCNTAFFYDTNDPFRDVTFCERVPLSASKRRGELIYLKESLSVVQCTLYETLKGMNT